MVTPRDLFAASFAPCVSSMIWEALIITSVAVVALALAVLVTLVIDSSSPPVENLAAVKEKEKEKSAFTDSGIWERVATEHPPSDQYSHFQPSTYTIPYPFSPSPAPAPNSASHPVLTVRCQNGGVLSGQQSHLAPISRLLLPRVPSLALVPMEVVDPMTMDTDLIPSFTLTPTPVFQQGTKKRAGAVSDGACCGAGAAVYVVQVSAVPYDMMGDMPLSARVRGSGREAEDGGCGVMRELPQTHLHSLRLSLIFLLFYCRPSPLYYPMMMYLFWPSTLPRDWNWNALFATGNSGSEAVVAVDWSYGASGRVDDNRHRRSLSFVITGIDDPSVQSKVAAASDSGPQPSVK
ncbi:hypothetical protein BU17DRAFT_60099 [Hysterangium stoloniferum]|nr:hypothetical protein BU17DRAFT_60099 [Hysterangium stoloniferum]